MVKLGCKLYAISLHRFPGIRWTRLVLHSLSPSRTHTSGQDRDTSPVRKEQLSCNLCMCCIALGSNGMAWQQGLTQPMCPHAAQPPKLTPTPLFVLAGQGESPPLLSAVEMSHFTFFQKEVRARHTDVYMQRGACKTYPSLQANECGRRYTPTGGVGRWRLGCGV
jgi:hypothetical protein